MAGITMQGTLNRAGEDKVDNIVEAQNRGIRKKNLLYFLYPGTPFCNTHNER